MKRILLILALLPTFAFSQTAVRWDSTATTTGNPVNGAGNSLIPILGISNANVQMCTVTTPACQVFLTTYTDSTEGTQCPSNAQLTRPNVFGCFSTADPQGNFGIWLAPGTTFQFQINSTQGSFGPYTATSGGGSGGGGGANPVGPGTIQVANAGANAFVSGGIIDTDVFGGAVPAQTTACSPTNCTMMTPPSSTSTEQGAALASVAGKPTSTWLDYRGGTLGVYATNPNFQNSSPIIVVNAAQALHAELLAYTGPYAGPAAQGSLQLNSATVTVGNGPGYSNGDVTCTLPGNALFCPQPGFTGASEWANINGYASNFIFHGSGIKGSRDENCFLFGTGDGQCGPGAQFAFYAGGDVAPSDEGGHMGGESQIYTAGDATGTIATITDPNHIKLSGVDNVTTMGQGRFLQDFTTVPLDTVTHAPLFQINADLVNPPQFTGPPWTPGTLVTNESNLPVSTAWGTLTAPCTVPIQDGGIAIGQNNQVNGCAITVTHGTFTTGGGLVCMAFPFGNEFNIGIIPIAVTGISGGQQTLTGLIHRSVQATALVYQGGTCGMGVLLAGDFNNNGDGNEPVFGSLIPMIGSTDAHTSVYTNYSGSQIWQAIPNPGSQFGTQDTGNSPAHSAFTVTGLVRTGGSPGLVHGTLTSGFNTNPPTAYVLNGSSHFFISGCSDSTMNSVNENHLIFLPGPTPQDIEYEQNGASSTCANAVIATANTYVTYEYISELYDVANHAAGVLPIFAIDGTITMSACTACQVGDAMDSPTHYSAQADGMTINDRIAQPLSFSAGLAINMVNQASYTGQAIQLTSSQVFQEGFMSGGGGVPGTAIHGSGRFGNIFHFDTYPVPGLSVIAIDEPAAAVADPTKVGQFARNFNLFSLQGGPGNSYRDTINYDADTQQFCFTFNFNGVCAYKWNPAGASASAPMSFVSTQFEAQGAPQADWTQLGACTPLAPGVPPGIPICFQAYIPQTAALSTNCTGGGCTAIYDYELIVNDQYGLSAPKLYQVFSSWPTLTGSDTNTLPCTDVPPGGTGTFYLFLNTFMSTVGTCTSPSTVLTDTGTYGANVGPTPIIAGKPLYSGAFLVPATTGIVGFTQLNAFSSTGAKDAFNPTASFSQITAGVIAVNTTAVGNNLGTLTAGGGVGPSTAALWTTGVIDPTGSCSTGSLYSNTAGASTHVLWTCVASAWVDVK